jgi:hypothetical protein
MPEDPLLFIIMQIDRFVKPILRKRHCLVMFCVFILPRSVADPDPESGAFLTRDPRWVKNKIRIRDEHPRSYFRELSNNFLGLKYRYQGQKGSGFRISIKEFFTLVPGSGMEKIRIREPG